MAPVQESYVEFALAVKQFIRDLIRSFPGVIEFKLILAAYKVVKTFSKRHVYTAWTEAVDATMLDIIMRRDETILVSSTAEFHMPPGYGMYESYLPVFRNVWRQMDEHSKEAVWRHLRNLVVLADKCKMARSYSAPA
jgi:hypothetical protein